MRPLTTPTAPRRSTTPAPLRAATPAASRQALLPFLPLLLALAVLLTVAGAALGAAGSGADAILGKWRTEAGEQGGRATVEIRRQGDRFAGTIVALEEPRFPADHERAGQPKVDLENPDASLRERPIVGLRILSGFTYDGDGRWSGGTIYDPANGKTYKSRLTLAGAGTLDVRGYVGVPLFGRTTTWKRVD